jgi:uncharacterized membrane protein
MMDPRRERALLLYSLLINLFLAATIVVLVIRGTRMLSVGGAPGPLRQVAESLDPAHRQALIAVLQSDGRALRPENQRARALRQDAWRSLGAPDFDPAKVKAELAQARALNQDASGKVQDSLIDFAAALPIDQRASLGRAMLARMPRAPRPRPEKPSQGTSGG